MVLPSRLSGRGAAAFLLIFGGYPTGLKTVILSSTELPTSTDEGVCGAATIFSLDMVPGCCVDHQSIARIGRGQAQSLRESLSARRRHCYDRVMQDIDVVIVGAGVA